MKRLLKELLYRFLYYTGLEFVAARFAPANRAAVLMYHGVCAGSKLPPDIDFHVTPAVFERQLRMLRRRYAVTPLSALVDRLERGEALGKAVVITFDDGYRNNYTDAAPALERHGLPYTVFLATDFIGTNDWIPLNEVYDAYAEGKLSRAEMDALRNALRTSPVPARPAIVKQIPRTHSANGEASFAMLTWEEAAAMTQRGAEMGSHTRSHCNMAAEDDRSQREELEGSKREIEERLGRAVVSFAYPYGRTEHADARSRRNAVGTGYRCAIAAEYGAVTPETDPFWIPRLGTDERPWFFACETAWRLIAPTRGASWPRAELVAKAAGERRG